MCSFGGWGLEVGPREGGETENVFFMVPGLVKNGNKLRQPVLNFYVLIIGCKEVSQKGKQWWCKSIDEAIQAQKQACKDHRKWSHGNDKTKE